MSLPGLAVRRPVGTAMIFFSIVVLGLVAVQRLPVDLMPRVAMPRITVVTMYEGVAPEEIETLITRPVEQTVSTIEGLRRLESVTSEGISRVALWFDWGTNLERAVNDVRAQLDRLRARLPEGADPPVTYKFDLSSFPIAFLGLSGGGDVRKLRHLAEETLSRRLERIAGVAAVHVRGGRVREIQVRLETQRLAALNLTPMAVSEALSRDNRNVAAGTMLDVGREVVIRTVGEFASVEEIARSVVTTRDGRPIYVRDLGTVVDTFKDLDTELWVNGKRGLQLRITKQDDANTVEVLDRLKVELARISDDYRDQLELTLLWDSSNFIRQAVDNVRSATIYGGLLAVMVLLLFLRSVRATSVIASAIPISLLAAFALMYLAGFSLNVISFGGLALGIGMLVDSAIVILENIYHRRERGEAAEAAATRGSEQVSGAIVASTTTTLVVFAPVLFVAGFAGVFFKEMAVVVSFALLCALAVALTLVPSIAARALRRDVAPRRRGLRGRVARGAEAVFAGVEARYGRLVDAALRHPWRVVLLALVVLGASCSLGGLVGVELMPESDEGQLDVQVQLPVGTPIETTAVAMQDAERRVRAALRPGEIASLITSAGPEAFWRPQGGNEGNMRLSLTPISQRERSLAEIEAAVRQSLAGIAGFRAQIRQRSSNLLLWIARRGGDRLVVEIRGHDHRTATRLGLQVQQLLGKVRGVTFSRVDQEEGKMERVVRVDRTRLAELGLNTSAVASAIEHYVLGKVTTRLRDSGDEYDIRVGLREQDRLHLERLADLPLATSAGRVVPLSAVARIHEQIGPASIRREGQERVLRVNAGFAGRPLDEIVADIQRGIDGMQRPEGFSIGIGGELAEQQETFSALAVGILLALFLVFAVMAVQFESLRHPLVVMAAVPFAFIGVVATLAASGITFNINSFLGCIVLVGIVVNNAIVLIDRVNSLRRQEGVALLPALQQGARRRLRPILMTTLTTALGMLPLALGLGEGSEIQSPLAAVVVGGLLTSAAVTLLLIPCLYLLVERRRAARATETIGVG